MAGGFQVFGKSYKLGNKSFDSSDECDEMGVVPVYKVIKTTQLGENTARKENLGFISEEFESNGNPATISSGAGDAGGKSYGAWQFASTRGVPQEFVKWLKGKNLEFYNLLSNAISLDNDLLGVNFDNTWKNLGKNKKQEFWDLQHEFTKINYYDKGVKQVLKYLNYDISKASFAMQNVLWSCAVQHGPRGKNSENNKYVGSVLFFSKTDLKKEESKIIIDIYDERSKVEIYFKTSSTAVKAGVKARFIKEKKKALELLNKEKKI